MLNYLAIANKKFRQFSKFQVHKLKDHAISVHNTYSLSECSPLGKYFHINMVIEAAIFNVH